jgi:hypothetical protein
MRTRRFGLAAASLFGLAAPGTAAAGPPFITDDPQPTERGRWEIYAFAAGAHVPGETDGESGLDLNYGAAKDLQLTLVIPASYRQAEGETHVGMGVVEAAAKLKLLHQEEDGWKPDLAVFPRLFLPTAPARFASRQVSVLLPLWAQKDLGPWSVFGGGGWQYNPGADNHDFWSGGLAITRQVSPRLSLGAEITHRTRDSRDGHAFSGVNLGMTYRLTDHWSLLASGGPGIENADDEGRYDFYMSVKADY